MREHCVIRLIDSLRTKRLVVMFVSLFAVLFVYAQDVSYNQAKEIAADFFKNHGVKTEMVVAQKARLKAPAKSATNSPYYIFNSSDASAFVIVSGDSRTQSVFAYSTEGAFDENNVAPGAAYMLEQYELYVNSLQDGANLPMAKANVDFGFGKLIETALWNQNPSPWWDYCPKVGEQNTYAGCVATAMAILMRHYEWPAKGFGSKSYTTPTHSLGLSANFEEFDYNWASLPIGNMGDPGWNDANKALVGKLLYQCGVAASMNYDTSGSEASSINQAVGLFRYFGYSLGNYIEKNSVSDDDWYSMIIEEINGDNPILYTGVDDSNAGHSFICDGYDAEGKLHFNYGWSGNGNGYYAILSSTYCNNQNINIGIRPDNNAATRILPDFQMTMNMGGSEGILIDGGIIHRGQSFYVTVNKLFNTTDQDVTFNLALFICDGEGTQKQKLVEYKDLSLGRGYYYSSIRFGCNIPYDYSVNDTDRLALFSSSDGGSTWKQVTCYDSEKGSILLKDVYDETPLFLKMISIEGQELGLTLSSGDIALDGSEFTLTCNCLWNSNSESFKGEVAIFLCDSENNRIMQVGSSTMPDLQSMYYYDIWNIPCQIPSTTEVRPGYRLCAFERYEGSENWSYIECMDDSEKAYIEIPKALISTTQDGDLNDDGEVDINDVVKLVGYILDKSISINEGVADLNDDGEIDVSDVVMLVAKILNE